jgi:hypothetical protein
MTANPSVFSFADSTNLTLEIPHQVDLVNQGFSHPSAWYQAYLNEICLSAVLPWLQEDFTPQAKVWPYTNSLASIWELVNGTAVTVDVTKFILVPSETIDLSEMRVPQEWVDLPSWVGDYYLAVQVDGDAGYVRVWGYCSHAQLKTQGKYDPGDRTYSIDATDITTDMSVLAVELQFCAETATRTQIAPLPTLPLTQAQNLITRLGNPQVITPRLAVPFELWGGLMEHSGWRKSLYERRIGLPEQRSVLQWLQEGVSQTAEAMGWGRLNLQLSAASARSVEGVQPGVTLSRRLAIAGQTYELLISPQGEPEALSWRFELRNATVGAVIPGGFKLRLLTEDLQPFPNNEDIATTAVEQLYVEVALDSGEGIVWEVEPLPENYDREILRF